LLADWIKKAAATTPATTGDSKQKAFPWWLDRGVRGEPRKPTARRCVCFRSQGV
jgi:hypothetical protein